MFCGQIFNFEGKKKGTTCRIFFYSRNLTASANIKLIWEEVTHGRKNMKAEVQVLNSEVTDLKRKIKTLERTLVANPAKRKPTSPCPECPVCFDEMKPPTKIVQCMSGHLICLKCRDRPEVQP